MRALLKCFFVVSSVGLGAGGSPRALGQDVLPVDATEAASEARSAGAPEQGPSAFPDRIRRIKLGDADSAKEAQARRAARADELKALASKLTSATGLPPGSSERRAQIAQTANGLKNLIERIRDDRKQAISAHRQAENALAEVQDELQAMPTEDPWLIEQQQEFLRAHQARTEAMLAEVDGASQNLAAARSLQRRARDLGAASPGADSLQLSDLKDELSSIPIDIASAWRGQVQKWLRAPAELDQVQALGGLFFSLMQLALLLFFGLWLHGRVPSWTALLFQSTEREDEASSWTRRRDLPRWVVPGDLVGLRGPLGELVQDIIVAAFGLLLLTWFQERAPPLAWVALIFVCGSAVRIGKGITSLALITPDEARPALRVVDASVRDGVRWVVHVFGFLAAFQVLAQALLVDILGAEVLGQLFRRIIQGFAVIATLGGLLRWSRALQKVVADGGEDSSLARWILIAAPSRPRTVITSVLAIGLIATRAAAALLHQMIESRAGLSWLGALLARRELRSDTTRARAPIPVSVQSQIEDDSLQHLIQDGPLKQAQSLISAWGADRRRGLLAITGDRGTGKHVLMQRLLDSFEGRVVHAHAPFGHTSEEQALAWLIRDLELSASPNIESVVTSLRSQPSALILISDIHRLFLRAVGHYRGIDAVLDVMQATADHHFWVASVHQPAWSFLEGMDDVGHVGIFQRRIKLGNITAPDMSAWLHTRMTQVQIRTDFGGLLPHQSAGADRLRRLERAERAFWRLMVDVSQGNPSVAMHTWVRSLDAKEHPNEVCVGVPDTADASQLDALSDAELFALTAIILHDQINVQELATVLNQSEERVRALCRGLEQGDLIEPDKTDRYRVSLRWLPATERHLRRRSFLHKD